MGRGIAETAEENERLDGLANTHDVCATDGTNALRCRLAVFQRDGLRVFHFPLRLALHTISFHDVVHELRMSEPTIAHRSSIDKIFRVLPFTTTVRKDA